MYEGKAGATNARFILSINRCIKVQKIYFPESKTYTVFAPTDAAFARLAPNELSRYSDKAAARALVARHVLPGTLYSAGMRYYQLRNSMEDAKPLTLQKNSGKR